MITELKLTKKNQNDSFQEKSPIRKEALPSKILPCHACQQHNPSEVNEDNNESIERFKLSQIKSMSRELD